MYVFTRILHDQTNTKEYKGRTESSRGVFKNECDMKDIKEWKERMISSRDVF